MSWSGGVVCGWGFVGMGSGMARVVYPTVLSSSFRRRASNLVPRVFRLSQKTLNMRLRSFLYWSATVPRQGVWAGENEYQVKKIKRQLENCFRARPARPSVFDLNMRL